MSIRKYLINLIEYIEYLILRFETRNKPEDIRDYLRNVKKKECGPSIQIETRDVRIHYGANCKKISKKLVTESNAYQAERYLLDYLKKAGLRAKYGLDDERKPKTLHIVWPSGGNDFGCHYSGEDLMFSIRPATNTSGNPILSIDFTFNKEEKEGCS